MKKPYIGYAQLLAYLEQVALEFPDLISVTSIGDTWEQRPIMLATLSLGAAPATKPALLFTGTIHAREWIGIELAYHFIRYVTHHYRYNPLLRRSLERSAFYIVPCLNPDGFEFSRKHFSFWRKNRRDNGDGTYGVDLNRNFGIRFKGRSDTSASTYSGPKAFSEPETQALRDFVESHPNIAVALDYHSQGNVFFPAHKFNHEAEVDTTDLNTLCANMAWEIRKVSGRRYGIHRGKPPTNLINGSQREYLYHRGILSTVVEVGTRNIPDYFEDMTQSVNENIPALVHALSVTANYGPSAPARPSQFNLRRGSDTELELEWDYEGTDSVYFEVFRSTEHKSHCNEETRVGITRNRHFTDIQLEPGTNYYYKVRAISEPHDQAGPFAPELKLRTELAEHQFRRTIFPAPQKIGYLSEKNQKKNGSHFGHNSLFVGVSRGRGVCYGVVEFNLDLLPDDAEITRAGFSLYPMNRVAAKIERFGEWGITFLDIDSVSDITSFDQIRDAKVLHTSSAIESDKVPQGIWLNWQLNGVERRLLQRHIELGRVLIRVEGPTTLPLGDDSQMMQFDIGFGPFGNGIHYRPSLDVVFNRRPSQVAIRPVSVRTVTPSGTEADKLIAGFDADGDKLYGQADFVLGGMPSPQRTVITEATLRLENTSVPDADQDIRFSVELAAVADDDYNSVRQRERIQYIGYEVDRATLTKRSIHFFKFDRLSRQILEQYYAERRDVQFLIRATTALKNGRNTQVIWRNEPSEHQQPELLIQFVERPRTAPPSPSDVKVTVDNGVARITWQLAESDDVVGAMVVRNRFHPPRSPFDGVKIYAGRDGYTNDRFGNANIPKYYAVFSYDIVPQYSTPAVVHFSDRNGVVVEAPPAPDLEAETEELLQSSLDD